jgi:hypothetical protein
MRNYLNRKPPLPASTSAKPTAVGQIIFLEKDGYPLLGINPLTNNYPPGGGGGGEQVITDAILTTTGEYIDVGDNFYLSF